MNWKALSAIAFSVAVIAAAIAAVVTMNSKADIARALAAKAESEEFAARDALLKAEKDATAAKANEKAQEMAFAAEQEKTNASIAEKETAKLKEEMARHDAARLADERKKAEAAQAESENVRKAEEAKAAAAAAEAEKARAEESTQLSREAIVQAALEKEKLSSERVIAEAKLLELRQHDLAALEEELIAYKRELDERERALRPEKTVADLEWVGEREPDVIGGDATNVIAKTKGRVLPENDRRLPKGERELARAERIAAERDAKRVADLQDEMVATLEKLHVKALKEDRMIDARFYMEQIKTIKPGWKFVPPAENKKEVKK